MFYTNDHQAPLPWGSLVGGEEGSLVGGEETTYLLFLRSMVLVQLLKLLAQVERKMAKRK